MPMHRHVPGCTEPKCRRILDKECERETRRRSRRSRVGLTSTLGGRGAWNYTRRVSAPTGRPTLLPLHRSQPPTSPSRSPSRRYPIHSLALYRRPSAPLPLVLVIVVVRSIILPNLRPLPVPLQQPGCPTPPGHLPPHVSYAGPLSVREPAFPVMLHAVALL